VVVLTWSGVGSIVLWTQVSTRLWDFATLWLIQGCALGPLEASALGGKTSSPDVYAQNWTLKCLLDDRNCAASGGGGFPTLPFSGEGFSSYYAAICSVSEFRLYFYPEANDLLRI